MALKTNCSGCIWKTLPKGCELDKPIFLKDIDGANYQFTPGYCRHRRSAPWAVKNVGKELLDTINEEEASMSCVVVVKGDDLTEFKKTVNSIVALNGKMSQVVASIQCKNEDCLKSAMDVMNLSGLKWDLDHITDEEDIDPEMMINYTSRLVKNSWFMSTLAGDLVDPNVVKQIENYMTLMNANFAGFYFDPEDNTRLVVSRYAFRELGGNANEPWLSKIKKFDGWENICLQLIK